VAAVLGQINSNASRSEIDGWWAWLSRYRFEQGDFTLAAILRAAIPGGDARPRQALVDVAARRGMAALSTTLSDAVLEEGLSQGEWQALLAVGVHELLRTGGTDLAGAVGIARTAVGSGWAELAAIALRWWDEALRPLPIERIRRGEQHRQDVAGAADKWDTLESCLGAFERYSPPFRSGSATKRFLLRAGGPLNLLLLATQARDRDAVRTWMEDPKLEKVDGWVDAATRAAGVTELIHGHLRPPFVDRIEGIIAAAGAVAEHEDVDVAPPEHFDKTIDAAHDCLEELRAVLPQLQSAAATIDLPERALAEAALWDLERLSEGGAR